MLIKHLVLKKLELEELLCNTNMWNNFMKDWDELTDLKKALQNLKKEIKKFKDKFIANLKGL